MPRLKLLSSPVVKQHDRFSSISSREFKPSVDSHDGPDGDRPKLPAEDSYWSIRSRAAVDQGELPSFVKHDESTNIELFYDLFFVANLTTFSDVHEVNDAHTLTSYIGFFCVLWFTWCQTSLFDIRFVSDSMMERAAKACHLGVMVGLTIVGPNYSTEDNVVRAAIQTLAIILCISRFVLGLQYSAIGYQVRHYPNCKLPFGLLTGTMWVSSIIYLGLSFAVKNHPLTYRAFYVLAAFEMVGNIGISAVYKVLSFKRSHLAERMSLLTLYILGEGVIDLLKSVGKIVQVQGTSSAKATWTPGTIGVLVAALVAIYFLYMLYFDCLNRRHFGTIREQVWAFLHFPFHVALVLAMSAMAQFVKWYKVVEIGLAFETTYEKQLTDFLNLYVTENPTVDTTPEIITDLQETLNATAWATIYPIYNSTYNTDILELNESAEAAGTFWDSFVLFSNNTNNATSEDAQSEEQMKFAEWGNAVTDLEAKTLNAIFRAYGFEGKEHEDEGFNPSNFTELLNGQESAATMDVASDFQVIAVVYLYFFIAAGMTLVLLGIMSLIMDTQHGRWSRGTIIRFCSHFLVGLAVALVSIGWNTQGGFNLQVTAWMIPIWTFAITIVLVLHHIKYGRNDTDVDEIDYTTTGQEGDI